MIRGRQRDLISDVIAQISKNPLTDGLTLSGGEPFMQREIAQRSPAAHEIGLNVWTYKGYTFEQLQSLKKR
jgi:anaerobic ribonucleoside-triphosphate reductase activating protein